MSYNTKAHLNCITIISFGFNLTFLKISTLFMCIVYTQQIRVFVWMSQLTSKETIFPSRRNIIAPTGTHPTLFSMQLNTDQINETGFLIVYSSCSEKHLAVQSLVMLNYCFMNGYVLNIKILTEHFRYMYVNFHRKYWTK